MLRLPFFSKGLKFAHFFAAVIIILIPIHLNSLASPMVGDATGNVSPGPILSTFEKANNKLLNPRGQHMTLVIGDYIYVFGGRGKKVVTTVERAPIRKNGEIGPFLAVPELSLNCVGCAYIYTGKYVYIFGESGNIYRSTVIENHALSRFQIARNIRLVEPRFWPGVTRIGNFVYVIGGSDGDGPAEVIERAAISSDGELGPFSEVFGVTLATPCPSPVMVSTEKFLYLFTGNPDVPVEKARIMQDGRISSFQIDESAKPLINRIATSVAKINSDVYLIGGSTNTGTLTSVERAKVDSTGQLSSFSVLPGVRLQTGRHSNTSIVINDKVVIIGGIAYDSQSKQNTYLNTIEIASILRY